jgi:hypothetical protein
MCLFKKAYGQNLSVFQEIATCNFLGEMLEIQSSKLLNLGEHCSASLND